MWSGTINNSFFDAEHFFEEIGGCETTFEINNLDKLTNCLLISC